MALGGGNFKAKIKESYTNRILITRSIFQLYHK